MKSVQLFFTCCRIKIERHPVCHIKMIDSNGSWIHQEEHQTSRSGGKYVIYFLLHVKAECLVMDIDVYLLFNVFPQSY